MAVQVMGTQAITNNQMIRKISEWEQGRCRGMQRLRRELRRHLTALLAMAVVICMILTCAISYNSIKVQANTGFKYYTNITVESGDTLWSIADRYIDYGHYKDKNAYITEVEGINHLDANDVLLAGQRLIVPYYSAEYVP